VRARRSNSSHPVTDCACAAGTSFRPAYTRLKAFIDTLSPRPPVMALTASAGEKGRAAIATALGLHEHRLVMTSFDRKNIRYEVRYPDSYDDPGWQNRNLLALLRGPDALGAPLRCGVVYCRAKDACEDVATLINKARIPGITAAAYHAGIGDKARRTVQADWRAGRITLAVATVAFGMGASARLQACCTSLALTRCARHRQG
jgi:ATP-dependent DNA helicase RecQ